MVKAIFDNPLAYTKQRQREAADIRAELARQEATPLGQAQLEVDRLQAQFDQQEKPHGAQAMIEAQKIQAANPNIRIETALLMATRR